MIHVETVNAYLDVNVGDVIHHNHAENLNDESFGVVIGITEHHVSCTATLTLKDKEGETTLYKVRSVWRAVTVDANGWLERNT